MADISKCANQNCKIKGSCYRYTVSDGLWQSYSDFNDSKEIKNKKDCKYYIFSRRLPIEDVEEIIIDEEG